MTEQPLHSAESSASRQNGLLPWACAALASASVLYFVALRAGVVPNGQFSPIFNYLLVHDDAVTAWVALAASGVVLLNRRHAFLRPVARRLGASPHYGAIGALLLALGAVFIYDTHPLAMDEYAAVFQARVFAAGQIWATLPSKFMDRLIVSGFQGEFFIVSHASGRVIEAYWPGFSMLLAPFEFLRAPWLCNAVLSAAALLLIHRITLQLTQNCEAAGWSMILALASGAFVANGISFYAMQAHLTLNLLFAYLLLRPTTGRALYAGFAGSLALVLHNPVPHIAFALPWVAGFLLSRRRRIFVPALLAGYAPGLLLAGAWLALRLQIGAEDSAVGVMRSLASGAFAWPDALILNMRLAAAVKMILWAVPGLFVLAYAGMLRWRHDFNARLLSASALCTFLVYCFVMFDQGHGWGFRYFHSAWGVIPVLAAAAIAAPNGGRCPAALASTAVLISALVMLPLQLWQVHRFIEGQLSILGPAARPGNNVYFVHPRGAFYAADMIQSDPLLRAPDLVMVSRGAARDEALVKSLWPDAVHVLSTPACEQWYLGPTDRRATMAGTSERRFVLR